jgi:hypothetical protein
MKNHISQLDMLEKQFMEDINTSVLNLLSIKYSQKVSEIAKCQISHIIQNRIDETIWVNELKDNLNKLIIEYGSQLQEEKKQLNIRMDFLEQRMLDMLRRMDSL